MQRIETRPPRVFELWPVIHRDARGVRQLAPRGAGVPSVVELVEPGR